MGKPRMRDRASVRAARAGGVALALTLLGASAMQRGSVPGGDLRDGMKLHYFSNGAAIPPWS